MSAARIDWGLVEAATSALVGVPFQAGARGPAAFDCWGLVLELRRRLGLALPPDYRTGEITRDQAHALFHAAAPAPWRRVALTPGAVVLSASAAHAGVYLAGRIVHAQATAGVVSWPVARWIMVCGAPECWEVS